MSNFKLKDNKWDFEYDTKIIDTKNYYVSIPSAGKGNLYDFSLSFSPKTTDISESKSITTSSSSIELNYDNTDSVNNFNVISTYINASTNYDSRNINAWCNSINYSTTFSDVSKTISLMWNFPNELPKTISNKTIYLKRNGVIQDLSDYRGVFIPYGLTPTEVVWTGDNVSLQGVTTAAIYKYDNNWRVQGIDANGRSIYKTISLDSSSITDCYIQVGNCYLIDVKKI